MVCGLLVRLELLPILPLYLSLMVGDLIGDIFWYYIGYFVGHPFIKKFGKYFGISEDGVTKVTRLFHRYHERILIVSKITMGFGFALVTLVTAGIVKIPFKKYLALNVFGQFVWTAILMLIGYFLGHLYVAFDNVFSRMFVIAMFIIMFLALMGYGKYIKTKITKKII